MFSKKTLPPMARFPEASWRAHIMPEEWTASLDAWISLAEAHLSLSSSDFELVSAKDESVLVFLTSYTGEAATSQDAFLLDSGSKSKPLRKVCFLLTKRLLETRPPSEPLLNWNFLAMFCKAYGKTSTTKVLGTLWQPFPPKSLEMSLASFKSSLIEKLEGGLKGKLTELEQALKLLNHLLHSSPDTVVIFMNGTDFLDGLVSCYKLMSPLLRKAILSTTYLCLIGLTEGTRPKFSLLIDQLYSLKAAAESQKAGPISENNSLVVELVTSTPILKQTEIRIGSSGPSVGRVRSVIASLGAFRKAGVGPQKRLIKRKVDKGKAREERTRSIPGGVHVHRMSLICQVQDLFPDLGSGFVLKLLDESGDNAEQVISHLLEGFLPAHLAKADRTEALDPIHQSSLESSTDIAPRSTPPLLPTRRNVFDDDEFDQLTLDTSLLHFGRKNPGKTADDILNDRTDAPNKAAILSSLAAFDSDDDERDDTYDVEDVGGTVDSAAPGNNPAEANADTKDPNDEALFRAYKIDPCVFNRDAPTRRGKQRATLRDDTRMTDEAIEGWFLMLSRDSRRLRRLEAKFSTFTGGQRGLAPTAWRGDNGASGTEDTDTDGGGRGGRGKFRGRGGHGRGGGDKTGKVAGPAGDKDTEMARRRKEANKGSRANHNRKDAAARKMARGGFTV